MKFGVCYYPEHWPETQWESDAEQMRGAGISIVRIGEFAWSRLEPSRGQFEFDWLDRAIDVLSRSGLEIILGTPTATPPKWLIDQHPEILAYDKEGRPRKFGSRRHYCFSSEVYRQETRRIVEKVGERYGQNPAIVGWQIDNEYGCHDTVRSYSPDANAAFKNWLADRYPDIDDLNSAWGNVFWSQEYRSFDEVDLPNLTTTEPNPSHVLDFYRFSSDQVISYHCLQADLIRELSPNRDIYHNVMGHFTDFDHFALGKEVDVLGWDSYPLGFLDNQPYSSTEKADYLRQGHPDFAAFHHDLYRACSPRWGLLELQPGPVNWAPHNPAPNAGMVKLWLHEAAAHGAELSCIFRWRQAPFAQEQYHAGLLRVDGSPAPGLLELAQCEAEQSNLTKEHVRAAQVALLFDYETQWMSEIQPQGDWNYFMIAMKWYQAARQLGMNIDIVQKGQDLSSYKLVLVPSLFHVDDDALDAFEKTDAHIVFGPRSGSKTESLSIPLELAPGKLQQLLPMSIAWCESVPEGHFWEASFGGATVRASKWLDHVETSLPPLVATKEGKGLLYQEGRVTYFAGLPELAFLEQVLSAVLDERGVSYQRLPVSVRSRESQESCYHFNYGSEVIKLNSSINLRACETHIDDR